MNAILRELAAEDGGILSHTATHAPNWGGRYESALQEARDSKAAIERVIDRPVQYVVSPFHQTPAYALDALVDSGYTGCIGGIIRNDPEFLFARGGCVAFQPDTVSSVCCMGTACWTQTTLWPFINKLMIRHTLPERFSVIWITLFPHAISMDGKTKTAG